MTIANRVRWENWMAGSFWAGLVWMAVTAAATAGPAPSPFAVPLLYFPEDHNLGISVRIGDADPQIFMLDTGSQALVIGSNMQYTGAVNTGNSGTLSYSAGSPPADLNVDIYSAPITFTSDTNATLTISTAEFAVVESVNNAPRWHLSGSESAFDNFAGILGASPSANTQIPGNDLFSLLGQVDFASLGTVDDPVLPGYTVSIADQRLYLGISTSYWESLTMRVPMNGSASDPTFPNNPTVPTHQEAQVNVSVTLNGDSATTSEVLAILDSGQAVTTLYQGTALTVDPADTQIVNHEGPDDTLVTGCTPGWSRR